jgi:hypothetical protein
MSTTKAEADLVADGEAERDYGEPREAGGADPQAPEQPRDPEPRPRRIVLPEVPDRGGLNLQFVTGADRKKAPPAKKPNPVEQAQSQAQESWERQAASLGASVAWTLERTAPQAYQGREVPCGNFPQEFTGPATITEIARAGGGGTYFVNYTDEATGKSRKIGPIKIAGAPKFNVGISDEGERNDDVEGLYFPGVPPDFRAGSAPRGGDDEWITTFDTRTGVIVKRRKGDLDREAHAMRQEPGNDSLRRELQAQMQAQQQAFADLIRRQSEDTKAMVQGMMQALERASAPKGDDTAAKFLEIERERLRADATTKSEEMKYLREKLDAEKAAAELRMSHERELAEQKLEAEKVRAEAERKAAEAKLEAERDRIAAEKAAAEERLTEANREARERVDRAHEAMLAALREKSDPMGQVSGIFSLFREFSDIAGDPEKPHGDDGKPKTKLDRFLGLIERAADHALPALEPFLKSKVEGYMAEARAGQPQVPQVAHRPQPIPQQQAPTRPQKPKVTVTPVTPAAPPVDPAQDQAADGAAIIKLVGDVTGYLDRNLAASVAAGEVSATNPRAAKMLRAYTSVDHLADELSAVAPLFGPHEAAITTLIERVRGDGRKWASDFLTSIRKAA